MAYFCPVQSFNDHKTLIYQLKGTLSLKRCKRMTMGRRFVVMRGVIDSRR